MNLNRRLTRLQDAYFITKAQITRSRNFAKKFHARRKVKIKKDIIDELTSSGFSEFESLFKLEEK